MIQDFFTPENLIFNLDCFKKQEAITLLVNHLNRLYHITDDPDRLVDEFMRREKKGSTGLQNGIAIPHVKTESLKKFYLAVGIHRQGIDFNSIDGKPTHIIFILIAPLSDSQTHLRFLSTLSRVFLKKDFHNRIIKEKTPAGVCSLFKEVFHD